MAVLVLALVAEALTFQAVKHRRLAGAMADTIPPPTGDPTHPAILANEAHRMCHYDGS